jgi:hypothetical protein
MSALLGARTRAFTIVGVLALAAVGAGLLVLGRGQSSPNASPGLSTPATTPGAAPAHPRVRTPTTPSATPAKIPATTPSLTRSPTASPSPAPKQTSAGGRLPAAIQQALASNHVVVVALYDPSAKIDGTALSEASAGAQLAGTTFVPVDVTRDDVAALNTRYGVIQDPAVLVLRPPGDLVVRIDGFADRDTVAQAAANAAA